MKKIYLYLLLALPAVWTGCKDDDYSYGDKGAPEVSAIIDPANMVVLDAVTVGQFVEVAGQNMRSVNKLTINDTEVAVSTVTKLETGLYFKIPRLPRSESYLMTIVNDFGSTQYPLEIGFPPFALTGIFNEWAPAGTEFRLLGESMDLYTVVGVSKIKFNSVEATITAVGEDFVTCTVPTGVTNKAVVKFVSTATGEVTCPVRYRDDTYIIENLENSATTRYPAFVVPNATYPAPLNPAPTEGNQYSRIAGASGITNMVGNYNLTIPESYFNADADNYMLKFELCTIRPIAYRIAISINQGTTNYLFGPSAATSDPALMTSTDGVWQTFSIPMTYWKAKTGIKNLRVYIGSQPTGVVYDFCLDNFRLQPINWQ